MKPSTKRILFCAAWIFVINVGFIPLIPFDVVMLILFGIAGWQIGGWLMNFSKKVFPDVESKS